MKRYLIILTVSFLGTFLVAALINYTFLDYSPKQFLENAFDWQQKELGVVQTGDKTRPFKYYTAIKRGQKIETLILGSSRSYTVGSVREDFYNLTSESNPPDCFSQEIKGLLPFLPNLKTVILSLDLFSEFSHQNRKCPYIVEKILKNPPHSLLETNESLNVKDIISRNNLLLALEWWYETSFKKGFAYWFQSTTPRPYECKNENIKAIDYFKINIHKCDGFKSDGSNMLNYAAFDHNRLSSYLLEEFKRFEFNHDLLDNILNQIILITNEQIKIKLFIPPFAPKLSELLQESPNKLEIINAIRRIEEIAKKYNIAFINAMDAKSFGCSNQDFLDMEHAGRSCMEKVIPIL